ncbi:MAG: hypothetical protein FWD57_08105, partial [Polyangiaceae bacterium]|nr:hypothetical protein [Polyangiaceae bacterium]
MRTSIHDVWGSGKGPVRRAAPHFRLIGCMLVFSACMVSAGAYCEVGYLWAAGACVAWTLACWPPRKVVISLFLLGSLLFLPYFALYPLIAANNDPTSVGYAQSLIVPFAIVLRGMCGLLVCTSTITVLTAADLREAFLRLPVPSLVSAILLQIVHQSGTLVYETRRVASAMAVRGAVSG